MGQACPNHSELNIPIGMKSSSGIIVSAVLSFNNYSAIQVLQRYIGEETLAIQDRNLLGHGGNIIVEEDCDNDFVAQHRDFFIHNTKPETGFTACFPIM